MNAIISAGVDCPSILAGGDVVCCGCCCGDGVGAVLTAIKLSTHIKTGGEDLQ